MSERGAAGPLPGLVPRSPFQLRSLPIEFRWEVTRRHPYYQAWWILAKRHHEDAALECKPEPVFRQLAVTVLGAIGVTGPFVDPKTSFSELGSERLNAAWLSGAVQPMSLRGLAALLIAGLPKKTAGQVGLLLCRAAADEDEGKLPTQIQAMQSLATLDWPGLDDFPDEPFVSINPAASGRQVNEAISALLKQWKKAGPA